jgi:hypothetical protein
MATITIDQPGGRSPYSPTRVTCDAHGDVAPGVSVGESIIAAAVHLDALHAGVSSSIVYTPPRA